MKVIRLRREPSVRQINAILARVERDLSGRGLDVSRHGVGGVQFSVPLPWKTRGAGLIGAATSGRVRVTAGRGERRHVRYELKFTTLQALLMAASFALVLIGWQRARVELVGTVALLWLLLYLPAYWGANLQLRRIVATGAREVIDRRRSDRAGSTPGSEEAITPPSIPNVITTAPGESGRSDA